MTLASPSASHSGRRSLLFRFIYEGSDSSKGDKRRNTTNKRNEVNAKQNRPRETAAKNFWWPKRKKSFSSFFCGQRTRKFNRPDTPIVRLLGFEWRVRCAAPGITTGAASTRPEFQFRCGDSVDRQNGREQMLSPVERKSVIRR